MSSANPELIQAKSDNGTRLGVLQRRLAGVSRFWFYDHGSASFMGVALLGLLMLVPLIALDKLEIVPMILGMMQISVSAAVAWQLIRLAATEWSILIPEYRHNIFFQCGLMLLSSFTIGTLVSMLVGVEGAFSLLLLATGLGLSFIYLCLVKKGVFYLSILLYLFLIFLDSIDEHISPVVMAAVALANLALVWVIWKKSAVSGWHPDARSVYLNALEMGGVWLPTAKSYPLLRKLEKYLHPVNFFMGPLLALLIITMPIITLIVAAFAQLVGLQIPALFMLAQFSCMACTIVHWSRIQRWRGVETLFMLPGFSGKQGMIDAFNRSQTHLLILFTLIMAVTAALVSLFNPAITLAIWFHLVLSTFFSCGFLLGLGCACKTVLHLSMIMLIFVANSAWVSSSFRGFVEETDVWLWLAGDLALVGISILTIWWGSKKLWNGDLV
ncbi:hypothetical protein [Shewanella violacea]|uniref:Uncharacterized protein n=1 Tax=Shewanella violacea (strain JCM 10179 / CIP 106290 / LMG 19151 / DSS12) TaxID=637905 RepID=D4ZF97_SHEVD|nr:hypothetical protein [Shewanella violacea]BAJ04261.1 conserved hypothetical protein [Shewanella violacea DSS12]